MMSCSIRSDWHITRIRRLRGSTWFPTIAYDSILHDNSTQFPHDCIACNPLLGILIDFLSPPIVWMPVTCYSFTSRHLSPNSAHQIHWQVNNNDHLIALHVVRLKVLALVMVITLTAFPRPLMCLFWSFCLYKRYWDAFSCLFCATSDPPPEVISKVSCCLCKRGKGFVMTHQPFIQHQATNSVCTVI